MNKIKTVIGLMMMLTAMLISDKAYVFAVYIFAAAMHEFGHLIAARVLKIKVKEINFDFSGVRICIDKELTSYRSELILAAAGPGVNVLLAAIMFFCINHTTFKSGLSSEIELFLETGEPHMLGICGFFILASCIQAVINLMPVKSFDGGRILYCAIAYLSNEKKADIVVSVISNIFAFILWTISIYLMLRISSGLGIYVFAASVFMITLKDKYCFDG